MLQTIEVHDIGLILYLLVVPILYGMWQRTRGLSFEELLERSAREHELVHRVLAEHPLGGTWSEFQAWLGQSEQRHIGTGEGPRGQNARQQSSASASPHTRRTASYDHVADASAEIVSEPMRSSHYTKRGSPDS